MSLLNELTDAHILNSCDRCQDKMSDDFFSRVELDRAECHGTEFIFFSSHMINILWKSNDFKEAVCICDRSCDDLGTFSDGDDGTLDGRIIGEIQDLP